MNTLKIVGGIIAIAVGLYVGYQTVMHPINPADDTNKHNLQGYISSVMAIVLGVLLIMDVVG